MQDPAKGFAHQRWRRPWRRLRRSCLPRTPKDLQLLAQFGAKFRTHATAGRVTELELPERIRDQLVAFVGLGLLVDNSGEEQFAALNFGSRCTAVVHSPRK